MYSLKDIMTITNLGERTIRRYLSKGSLEGNKVGGVWRFSEGQLENFLGDQSRSIRNEATKQVYDFINLPNPKKLRTSVCIMIDLMIDEESIENIKNEVYDACNSAEEGMTMKFIKEKKNYRFIMTGTLKFINLVASRIYKLIE